MITIYEKDGVESGIRPTMRAKEEGEWTGRVSEEKMLERMDGRG